MGQFRYRPGGQYLILGADSHAIYTTAALSSAVAEGSIPCPPRTPPTTPRTARSGWCSASWTGRSSTTSSRMCTPDTVDQAAAGAYGHQIAQFAEVSGTGKRLSSVLMCRLARVADATEDTFDAVAFGLSVDFHILLQTHGSDDEYPEA